MAKSIVNLVGFSLIVVLFSGCQSKDVAVAKNKEKILIERETLSIDVYNREIEKLRKEFKEELEKLSKENQDLRQKLNTKKAETTPFNLGALLRNDGQNNETEKLKKEFESLANNSKQKIDALEKQKQELSEETEKLRRENSAIVAKQPEKEEVQTSPSVIGPESEQTVPVWIGINNYNSGVTYFKITSKKTEKFFVYEINSMSSMPAGAMSSFGKLIYLVPGEYTVVVNIRDATPQGGYPGMSRPSYNNRKFQRPISPQTFTVMEEPVAEINGEKVHAVLTY